MGLLGCFVAAAGITAGCRDGAADRPAAEGSTETAATPAAADEPVGPHDAPGTIETPSAAPSDNEQSPPMTALPSDLERVDIGIAQAVRRASDAVGQATTLADVGDAEAEYARVLFANRFYAEALRAANASLNRDGGQPKLQYLAAVTAWRLDRADDAVAMLAVQLESPRSAPASPILNHAPAYRRLAAWRLELGDLDGAQRSIRRAARLDAQAPGVRETMIRVHLQRDEVDDAARLVDQLITSPATDSPYARHLAVQIARQQGDLDAVRSHMDQADATTVIWPDPWMDELANRIAGIRHEIDVALGRMGRIPPAEMAPVLADLHQRAPANLSVATAYAATLQGLGNPDAAVSALRRAADATSTPPSIGYWKQRASALIALADARQEGDPDADITAIMTEAIDAARAGLALATDEPDLLRLLAQATMRTGDDLAAIAAFERAASVDSGRRAALRSDAALIHMRATRWDEAVDILTSVVDESPEFPIGHVLLATALANSNQVPEAIRRLEARVNAAPTDRQAAQLLGRLREISANGG
ncbi:MAG: tetratricopeptide repeat protein [Phycisphaerales bacterium]